MAIDVESSVGPIIGPVKQDANSKLRLKRRVVVKTNESYWSKPKRILRLLFASIVILFGAALVTLSYFYHSYSKVVDQRLASGYLTSRAGIYAAPRVLRVGQSIRPERLVQYLRRAGYVDAEASNVWNGRFIFEGDSILIQPRHNGSESSATVEEVKIGFDKRNRISAITGDGKPIQSFALEPEPLTNDLSMKTGERSALSYKNIPPVLVRAILAIEDRRFFEHHGLDPLGIARALTTWTSTDDNELKQGGSTITQQLVKNTYLTPERSLSRKFNEAILASVLERRLSKEDIFALYCNEIYLGQRGSVSIRGVEQAARIYFGKELKNLSLSEAATIAGMIQSPNHYAPHRHPEKAEARRNVVIEAMLREKAITPEELKAALGEPINVAPLEKETDAIAPHFIDYVNRTAETQASPSGRLEYQRSIYTTIDLELQQLAETAVRRQLERLDKVYKGDRRPQAALVALDSHTGHVLAMVGGRNYSESQLNRATDARRQPGSIFKPFVYAAALESGISPLAKYPDQPRTFHYDQRAIYRPANYGGAYSMRDVTARTALIRSLNVVTVDVAMQVGLSRIAALVEKFGLPKPMAYPALALGTTEATPLEIAVAYTAFANGGRTVRPVVVSAQAANKDYANSSTGPAATTQVIKPSTAYMITDMLTGVINQGTARAARGAMKNLVVAGKTGTSRDGWFVGYTPNLVCVVWFGFDDGEQLGLTGAESALPAWVEFTKGAVELRPELGGEAFERPAGISMAEIDPETGMLASSSCPQRERIAVTPVFTPHYECYEHAQPLDALTQEDEIHQAMMTNIMESGTRPAAYTQEAKGPMKNHASPPKIDASVQAMPNPSRPATQMERDRSGRSRLVNDVRLTFDAGSNR